MSTTENNERRAPRGHRDARRGFSLLELVAVIALFGLLALAAVSSFPRNTFGNLDAQVHARRLALDLIQTRRRAIVTGENHYLRFQSGTGPVTYEICRRTGGGEMVVDSTRAFAGNVRVSVQPRMPEFTSEGTSLAPCTITVTAPNRRWQILVAQATGSVRVVEL